MCGLEQVISVWADKEPALSQEKWFQSGVTSLLGQKDRTGYVRGYGGVIVTKQSQQDGGDCYLKIQKTVKSKTENKKQWSVKERNCPVLPDTKQADTRENREIREKKQAAESCKHIRKCTA